MFRECSDIQDHASSKWYKRHEDVEPHVPKSLFFLVLSDCLRWLHVNLNT